MSNGGNITYGIKLKVDSTDLNSIKNQLNDLVNIYSSMGSLSKASGINFKDLNTNFKNIGTSFKEVQGNITKVRDAFNASFNTRLGTLNFESFNKALNDGNINLGQLYKQLQSSGVAGTTAFRNMATSIFTTNGQLKQSVEWLDKIKTTFTNTAKWAISSSAMNSFTGSIQTAYNYINDLDKSLNNIRIVTKMSSDEMTNFAQQATNAAKTLGVATTDYTDAALIYYQQGLTTEQASERARITSQVSNVTGQSTEAVSEQLTSLWNGYQVALEDSELYVDKLAAVAAASASDLEELSTGMSKVASSANAMGVSADQLAATLSTIISVTRQAPESVGTALKTIYARMADIESGEDDETSLGNYTAEMANLGVNVLNAEGKLRDMGEVIEEVGSKWTKFSREQQLALAQSMAGTRQYNNLIALFDNWGQYESMLSTSKTSAGELSKQQDIYMESAAAHIQQMKTSWEDFYDSLFGGSDFNVLYDTIGGLANLLKNFVDGIGGGSTVFVSGLFMATKLLSGPLANAMATFVANTEKTKENINQAKAQTDILTQFKNANISDKETQALIDIKERQYNVEKQITDEQEQQINNLIKQKVELLEQQTALQERRKTTEKTIEHFFGKNILNTVMTKDSPSEVLENVKNNLENIIDLSKNFSLNINKINKNLNDTQDITKKLGETKQNSNLDNLLQGIRNTLSLGPEDNSAVILLKKEYQNFLRSIGKMVSQENLLTETSNLTSDDLLKRMTTGKSTATKLENLQNVIGLYQQINKEGNKKNFGNIISEDQEEKMIEAIQSYINLSIQLEEQKEKVKKDILILNENLTSVSNLKVEDKNIENIKKDYIQLQKIIGNINKNSNIDKIFDSIMKNAPDIQTVLAKIKQHIEETFTEDMTKEAQDALKALKDNIIQLEENLETASSSIDKGIDSTLRTAELEQTFEGIINGISKLGNIASSIMASFNLSKIFTDTSLSAGEKFLQIISNLSFILPGYFNLLEMIVNVQSTFNGIKQLSNILLDAENTKLTKNQILKVIEIALTKKSTNAKEFENIVGKDATKIGIAQRIAQKALNGEIDIGSVKLLQYVKNLKTFVTIWGPVILTFSTAAAMIGAMIYQHEKANIAAEKATESAKKASDAYREISADLEELKNNVDAFKESKTALEEMKYGTEEWNEKLRETNELVLEMLDKYPELAQYVKTNSDGLLEITNPDKIIELQQKQADFARMSSNQATLNANQKNLEADKEDFYNKFADKAVLTTLRTTAAGGIAGLIGGAIATSDDYLSEQQIDHLVNAINETNGAILSNKEELIKTYGISNELAESLLKTDNKKELLDMANQLKINTEQLRIRNQQDFNSYLINNKEGYSKLSSQEQAFVSQELSDDKDTYNKAYKEALHDYQWGSDKKNYEKYAELMRYDSVKEGWGGKGVAYKDGEKIELTDEQVEQALARDSAIKKVSEESSDEFIKIATQIKQIGDKTGYGASDILLQYQQGKTDFGAMDATVEEIEVLKEAFENGTIQIPEEVYKNAGKKNAKEYSEAFLNDVDTFLQSDKAISVYENSFKKAQQTAQKTQDLLDILSKGPIEENVKGSKNQEEAQAELDELEKKYVELGEIKNKSSHEYLELLRQIKEQEEDNALEALKKEKDIGIENVERIQQELDNLRNDLFPSKEKISAKTKELEEALQKVVDKEYEIKVQIDTDIGTDVKDAFGLAEEFGNLKDLIVDDLELTFDEAQSLINNGYGEVLQGAQETANQTIKINKNVLDAYIDNKQTELEVDKQAKIDQLEREKILLQNQLKILQSKQSILEAGTETAKAEDKKQIIANAIAKQQEYDDAVDAMEAELKADDIQKTKMSDNAAKFYNDLGQQYQIDSENRQNADVAANTTNSKYASNVINRFKNMFKAANNFAKAVWNSVTGKETSWEEVGDAGKELLTSVFSKNVESKYKGASDLGLDNALDLVNSVDLSTEELDSVIEQMKKDNLNEIQNIQNQIGSLDAGIAALKTAGLSLDEAQRKGGKKDSSKDAKIEDKLDKEKDRYHDINIELKQIQTNLSRLQDQQDKLFGQNLLDNLNNQLNYLNKQIDASNRKIAIANGELTELQGKLSQKGVTFNTDGTIANYATAYDAQLNYVNSLIDRYNIMDAESQESFKDTLDKAKNDFDNFVENIERYDEVITDLIPGLEDDIQAAIDEQIEIQVEKFNMEIEIRLDMAEAERDWNEFKKRIIDGITDEDILGNAKARLQDFFSYYKDDVTGVIQVNTKHVNDILTELKKMENGVSDIYGNNQTQALEDLKTYYEQLISDLNDIEDISEEVHQAYIDMMNEAQEKFEEQVSMYEQVSDLIEHDMKIIELVRGEDSYAELGKYYERQEENYNKQLDFQRQQAEFWKKQMAAADEGSEAWDVAKENWIDAVNDWNSAVEEAIENIQDKYLNTIEEIFDKLNNEITNGMGLEYVNDQWDLINKNADQYLDAINSMYGIQELEKKYLDAIDQTDSVSAQRQLNELMEEQVSALRQKDKLTEYDVERAKMRYEIALKEIALQEAQQNKSSMRLKRDSQGNYRYEFVADDDAVGEAEDELAKLKNDLYNFDLEHYKDNLDQVYSIYEEFQEKVKELNSDPSIDPEERAKKELLYREQYGELINGLLEQNNDIRINLHESAFEELADLYELDIENFQNMTDEEQDILLGQLIPQWESGVQQMVDKITGEGGLEPTCKNAFDNIKNATEDYEDSLKKLQNTAGVSFDDIINNVDTTINQTKDLIQDNNELVNSYKNQLDAVQNVINQLDTLIGKYRSAKNEAIAATEAAYKYWQWENGKAADAANRDITSGNSNLGWNSNGLGNVSSSGGASGNSGSGSSGNGNGSNNGGSVSAGQEVKVKTSASTFATGENIWGAVKGNAFYVASVDGDKILLKDPHGPNYTASGITGWIWKKDLEGFKTGGYTGNWNGENGKVAMLHQKELVLNADDTRNILDAVKIMRTMGDIVINRISALSNGISSPNGIAADMNSIKQNVTINADFPNVESSREIEDAFNNLMNIATQRIHERNK